MVPGTVPRTSTPLSDRASAAHLGVLCGDLQDQGQRVVVEVLVQGQQGTVHAALLQVPCVVPEPDGLDPVDHLLIGPDQHIWRQEKSRRTRGLEASREEGSPQTRAPAFPTLGSTPTLSSILSPLSFPLSFGVRPLHPGTHTSAEAPVTAHP